MKVNDFSMQWLRLASGILLASGALLVGCGGDDDASASACEHGESREFACGQDKEGSQPQSCVDGQWYSTSFCALPDGTRHSDDTWGSADDCVDGATRAAVCGEGNRGLQPEECRQNEWVATNACTFGSASGNNGNNGSGNNGNGNNGNGNNGDNGGEAVLPANPSRCQELTTDLVNGGKTLPQNACYTMDSPVHLKDGLLTIEPGVTIVVGASGSLQVSEDGRLKIEGTASNVVGFLGKLEERGYWSGIRIDTDSGSHSIEHAVIRHAGKSDYGLQKTSAQSVLTLENTRFESNRGIGLEMRSAPDGSTVSGNHFEGNQVPVMIPIDFIAEMGTDNTFDNNDDSFIFAATSMTAEVSGDVTWPRQPLPYQIGSQVKISGNLEIEAGTVMEFYKVSYWHSLIKVDDQGTLKAVGDAGNRIVFRGVNGEAGNWPGLRFTSDASEGNELDFVDILDAGAKSSNVSASIYLRSGEVRLRLGDVQIKNGKGYGIYTRHAAKLLGCTDVTFSDIEEDDWFGNVESPADCEDD